jgi:arabinofuranosyltransferase
MKKIDKASYLLLGILIVFVVHSLFLNCIAEDAFISFRYAKNLAGGYGLVWNIGEKPVEGYTNFLWVLISAALLKFRLNVLWFSQALGIGAGLLAIWYTFKFSWRLLGLSRQASLIPCLFLALSGPFAAWAGSGMETNLFALLVLMGSYYFISYGKSNSSRDLYFCFLSLFFATLTRPEGFLIFGLILGLGLILFFLNGVLLKNLIFPLLSYVIPFLAYFGWRFHYFGFLLPNTYYAKTGGTTLQYYRGLEYTKFFSLCFLASFLPLALWFIVEKRRSFLKKTKSKTVAEHLNTYLGIYLSLVIFLTYTLYIVYVGGDYMAMYRFFVPVLPFIYIIFGFVIDRVFRGASDRKLQKILLLVFVLIAAAATIIQSTPLEKSLFKKPGFMHGTYRGVETERWHTARLALLGSFFDKYRNNYDESVASTAIGAISYYADMKVIDFFGLVDPYLAHQAVRNLGQGMPGHEKLDLDYLFSKRPTYIMYRREFTKSPRSMSEFWNRPIILNEYKVSAVWLKDKKNNEEGYFSFLELKSTKHSPKVEKYVLNSGKAQPPGQ